MKRWLKKIGCVLYFGLLTLLVAEAIVMVLLRIFIEKDQGWLVIGSIIILPLWSLLITVFYLLYEKWKYSLSLWGIVIISLSILYLG